MAVVYRLIVDILTVWYQNGYISVDVLLFLSENSNKSMGKINRISFWIVSDKFFVVLV